MGFTMLNKNSVVSLDRRSMGPVVAALVVVGLWVFPRVWYVGGIGESDGYWVAEKEELSAWTFHQMEVSETAERILVADSIFSGEFRNQSTQEVVRVFSARRESDSGRDIGLFVHTPDRCWTESGWEIEIAEPDFKVVTINGVDVGFERRIFQNHGVRELVYFCGLVNGAQLPYRLDHNLNVGVRAGAEERVKGLGFTSRLTDEKFWGGIGNSFLSRRFLWGPKQFIRVSTPSGPNPEVADDLLVRFLSEWLEFTAMSSS